MTAWRPQGDLVFDEDFRDRSAFEERWIPHYLPQWSSRERSRARFRFDGAGLRLLIEADQHPWAPEWDGALRVSNLQTGVRSGPVGSGDGQHRFRPDLVVREAQSECWAFTPTGGAVAIRCRANPDPRTMTALWLIGVERTPDESAELCVMEVFGRELQPDHCLVGMGLHPFGDPAITDDFEKVPVAGDLTATHEYAAEWGSGWARWYVDGALVKESRQAPDYPLQLMLDIFEFEPDPAGDYPKEFAVESVRAWAPVSSR